MSTTPTPQEAGALPAEIRERCGSAGCMPEDCACERAFTAALAAARREERERAAQIVERSVSDPHLQRDQAEAYFKEQVAAHIRHIEETDSVGM